MANYGGIRGSFIAIFLVAILALQIVATPIAFAGHLRPVDISTDKDQNSVTGDPISITFSFMLWENY